MALTEKQLAELDIAQTRVNTGAGTDTDRRNIEFAKTKGFQPKSALDAGIKQAQETSTQIQKGVSNLQNQQNVDNSGLISSSESVVQDEQTTTNNVAALSTPNESELRAREASDNYITLLEDQAKQLEERRKAEVAGIKAGFKKKEEDTKEAQRGEVGSTSIALQRIGGFLGGSASHVGALLGLASDHRSEISALEAQKASAIQKANSAITDKQFGIAKLRIQEAKDIEQIINDRRNKFFDQSMQIIRERRLQESEEREAAQEVFKNSLDVVDRVAPSLVDSMASFESEEEAANFILGAARDFGVDPNILLGEVSELVEAKRVAERKELTTLGTKYPGAGISDGDSFDDATAKVRNSEKYQLALAKDRAGLLKIEQDIANTKSMIAKRLQGSGQGEVDFSDPILGLYTAITGDVVSSPGKARGIIGYADSILDGVEVVSDNFNGPLLDNQMRETDANNSMLTAFQSFADKEDPEEVDVEALTWQWLGSPNAYGMSDENKRSYIMGAGQNPEDFGIY